MIVPSLDRPPRFAAVLAALAPKFKEQTGATLKVDILDYGSLLTKTTADFVGHTGGYDLITMDIVWSGQYAESGYTVDLTDWIKRDASELRLDDIYPTLLNALGHYGDKQVAFPFAGYANVLAYRKDLYEAADLKPPAGGKVLTYMQAGMTSLSFGNDTWAGGDDNTPFGVGCFLPGTTLAVDGKVIVDKGELK